MSSRLFNMGELFIGRLVSVSTAAEILYLCPELTILMIAFPYRHINKLAQNPLLLPLNEMRRLKALYINLVSVHVDDRVVYLLDVEFFHHITHLHLSAAGSMSRTIPLGFGCLENMTHLSLNWGSTCSCTAGIKVFLARKESEVLVLWIEVFQLPSMVISDLQNCGIVSQ